MLDDLAHLGFFFAILRFSGFPSLLHCYFVSSILKVQIGKFSVKEVKKILDEQENPSQTSVLLRGCTFNSIIIDQPISKWTYQNWNDVFVNQIGKEQIMPKLIKKMIQRRYYHRLPIQSINNMLKRLVGSGIVRRYTKRKSKPLKDVKMILAEKKQAAIKGFQNIIKLFVLDGITGQRICFPNISILLNGIKYDIPKIHFFTKKMVSWGSKHVNKYEIIIENDDGYIGAITPNGTFYPRFKNDKLLEFLKVLQEHHLVLCKNIGMITKKCVFCTRDLTDMESLRQGYGKTCASTHHLPWGTKKRKMLPIF